MMRNRLELFAIKKGLLVDHMISILDFDGCKQSSVAYYSTQLTAQLESYMQLWGKASFKGKFKPTVVGLNVLSG